MRIVKISDLSDKEKEEWEKQLKESEKASDEATKKIRKEANKKFNSQDISLPTASSKIPSYRQNISTKMDRLPTARLSNDKVENYVTNSPLNILTTGALGSKINLQKAKIFNKPKELEDYYVDNSNVLVRGALGKVGKIISGTGTDITQDLAKGLISPMENVLDIGTNLVASGLATGSGALGLKNEKLASDLRSFANQDLSNAISHRIANTTPFGVAYNIANGTPSKIFNPAGVKYDTSKNIFENYKEGFKKAYFTPEREEYEKSSVLGEKADNAVEMIGYSFGNKIFGDLLPNGSGNIGLKIGNHTLNLPTLSIAGGMSGGLQEANSKKGVSEAERWAKGISEGLIESFSEGIFGALGVGGNDITDSLKVEFANKFSSKAGKMFAQLGIEQTGEAMEEFISYASNWIIDNGIINKIGNADFSSEWDWNDVIEQMVMAYVTTGISSGGNIVIENNSSIKSVEQQIGRELTQQEKIAVTQAVIDGTLAEKMQSGNPFSNQEQVVSQENKTALNQNIEQINTELPVANENNRYTKSQLDEMLNNKNLPIQSYQYEKSDNAKINNLRQDASKYFNNSEQARNYVEMLEKIITDKGVEIRFDTNLKTPDGKIANGSYSNGVITINPNSSRAGEFIAIHELTHAIGTNDMISMIENYRNSNAKFNSEVEQLLQSYNTTEISEEALADVSAQLFGNQEFINNIAQKNPNIFQKIYSEIKYLWHQFRGYTNQQQFIDDLYYKWTQEYNSNSELNNSKRYSVIYNEDGSFNRVKINEDIFENKNGQRIENTIKEYLKQHIGEYASIIESGQKVYLGKDLPGEYAYSKSMSSLPVSAKYAKGQAVTEIKEIIQNAKNRSYEPNNKTKHSNDAKYGFYRYDTKFSFKHNGKEQTYQGKILIRNDADGKKYLYDILSIKKIGSNSLSQASNSTKSSAIVDSPSSLPTNSIPSQNSDVNTTTKYSIQESENNSGSFFNSEDFKKYILPEIKERYQYENKNKITETIEELKKRKETLDIDTDEGWDNNFIINQKIKALENGYDTIYDYLIGHDINELKKDYKYNPKILTDKINRVKQTEKKQEKLQKEIEEASPIKRAQYEIIQKTNPMFDDEHVGIRSPADIKTFEEAIQDEESFSWGDYTKEDAERDLKRNKVKIYSSYAIKNGVFVSTSYQQALDYAGGDRAQVHSKEISPNRVAWINGDEGQYASINAKYFIENQTWQQYLDKNFESEGTKTKLSDIRLQNTQNNAPSAKNNVAETSSSKNSWSAKQEEVKNEEKIAEILEQPVEKVKEKDRTWAIMKANFVDKGIVFEELSHKTKNRELQGKWDYILTSSARGQNAIGQARYEMNAKTKTEKQICKGLEEIRAEVGSKTNDFQNYMYHQLNIDRMTLEDRFGGDTGLNYERKGTIKNKPVFAESVTAEISQKIVNQYEQKNPEFKKWAQDVYDFNNANKQELVKSGVISQELADTLGELYPHYVPIKRVNANGSAIKVPLDTNRTGVNIPLARAKGGNSDIQPLFQTLAERTMQTYSASARNNFGVELMNTLNSIQEKQQTDIDTILEDIGNTEQNAELLQGGKNGKAPTFTVFDNGEKVTFEITKDMYEALKPLSDSSLLNKNFFKGIPGKISNFRRGVLTEYNPLFLITNAIKDSQDVLINSQHALKTYSKFPEAYQQIISKGYWYNEYVRNGGEQNSYFKDGKFESDIKVNKAKSALQVPLNAISKINNVIETAPRLAEYIASREKGISIETSMLDAARVTTNFKAGGDITKALNRNGFTFLNASVQGASQQVRNIVEANTKGLKGYAVLATKYAIAGLPTLILNGLIWKDDKDYEELQDYVKDNYYIVGKYGDGKFIRIPKGRTTAVIQKLVNNVSEYVNKDKELNIDNFAKDFWTDLQFGFDNLAPNNPLDNNVISPIIQAITNKSWYGEDIVPSRLQDKPKVEQYDESTDSLSIWLGNKLNISPYKINYLLDQYGGGISDVVLPMMTKQAENNVFEDKFTTDSVMKNRYPGEFYSKLDELNIKNNSEEATDEDKLKYKWFSNISKTMSDFYKQKREIQNSDLSDEEKKKQLKEIQKKINELAEGSLNEVDDIEVSGDIADVDDTQYYKYDGEWTKLSDKDNKKTQNISLSTYADYKNKIKSETDKQREAGDISENGSLKTKDKIKVLINSNYSNKEKTELYENYVLSSSDKEFPIIKEVFKLKENGLDINKYLDYKSQEFESDREDDGTVKGKSIYGSKKGKVFDYIDSIDNASYSQKLILYALEYKPTFRSDRDIVCNFIDSLPNKTNEEKLKILECFPGVKIYKDGTFDY